MEGFNDWMSYVSKERKATQDKLEELEKRDRSDYLNNRLDVMAREAAGMLKELHGLV